MLIFIQLIAGVVSNEKVITQQVALQMASLSLVGTDSSPAFLEFISLPHSTSRITIDRAVKWTFNEDIVLSISPLEFYTSAEKASFHSLRIQGNFYYKNQPQWMLWWQENYWQQPVDWSDNSISTCGGISMLGGYGKFAGGEVQKTFVELPQHSKVRIVANYHFIDGWGGETGFLRASIGRMDGMEYVWTEKYDYSKVKNGISVCGSRYPEGKLTSVIDVSFPHTKDTIKLGFGSTLDNDPLENSFGISNLQIYLI
ncbi:unnamed protein product (macronuclear) [Paramecium tetraurelia]|uniref:NADH:ubiquinone oxidoreductase intermediate-associated protein 30 domain-containing protein n=1 Tax=Paramecium tetraurelia TaxID=5888 RepID=A0DYL8_PARTE|nr:uncharacterized protein GSPATT00003103001 [Paramecium tetraurelia]CAK88135.1 unnamed protein product [Paramecium tetraurelia]|eukprot:XP_001455532.1 hypothetical protein (macronuclear) [Paramecium tetraurelia strain d4-2]